MAPKAEYADNLQPSREEEGTIEGTTEEIIDNPDKATAFAITAIDEEYNIDSDNSPQPEVRANVPNVDDPSMPVNTLRVWMLGLLFTILGTGINQFFSMRYPSVTISSLVAQLLAYPAGRALAHALPIMKATLFGREIALNPDHHFNIKEHALITIMSNLSFGPSWATDIIQAQTARAFLGLKTPVGYQFLLALTMQLFGLGMAGMAYRFIVEPPHMVWPSTLANAALFQTLHGRANPVADGWGISRYRFFVYVFAGGWLWYWLPGFLFTGLSTFAFICWAAPNNIIVNNLFGMSTGLAYLPTTFDWSQIAYNGSPLVVPFWAQANVFAGWVILFALVTPILYYTNTWYTAHLPFSGGDIYDNTGNIFNVSKVVDQHGNFSPEDYHNYSPIFMPVTFAFSYGISFATMTCVPTFIFLNYWKQIVGAFNTNRKKDIHARLIERYPDAPWWWYAALTAIVLGLTIMVQEVYHTQMPVWGVFLAFGLAAFYLIPTGSVYAVANLNSNVLTVLGEIISGYAIPGKPVVMLIFKFYAYTGLSQAMIFASDMKLGLYMKIPRRTLFVAQLTACIVGSLTQNAVVLWMLHHVKDICESDQPNKYTCPQGRVNFSSSIVWGAVGPARLYSVGKIYSGLLHLFWLGALLPVVTFFAKKKFPNNKFLSNLHWPLFFAGTGNVPPATGINYSSAFAVSFIFNKWIRGKYPHWWAKYNYVLSAALDSGLAVSAIVIFFALVFPGVSLSWWGNNVQGTTADGLGSPSIMTEKTATCSNATSEESSSIWTAEKALENLNIGKLRNTPHKDLLFFHLAGQLKRVIRAGWKRYNIPDPESVSDHSWRMSLLAICLPSSLGVDLARVSQMTLVHDIGEVLVGDITPHDKVPKMEKRRREEESVRLLSSLLGGEKGKYILDLWLEFEENETKESQVARDLDEIEMVFQAVEYEYMTESKLGEFMTAANNIVTPEVKDWALRVLGERDGAWN
ncbi:OPT family small oligopeptide transporter [Fusarium austroafricanum]|uniref:5'-deoxynucleotidase n=1 Tax=Fusarium austroafricanum TaxID=2364996 RepID=A0A8H4NYW4_9HYPO|nr:OPT family small oligopeptide transporter [Fusarium austroafricanum]